MGLRNRNLVCQSSNNQILIKTLLQSKKFQNKVKAKVSNETLLTWIAVFQHENFLFLREVKVLKAQSTLIKQASMKCAAFCHWFLFKSSRDVFKWQVVLLRDKNSTLTTHWVKTNFTLQRTMHPTRYLYKNAWKNKGISHQVSSVRMISGWAFAAASTKMRFRSYPKRNWCKSKDNNFWTMAATTREGKNRGNNQLFPRIAMSYSFLNTKRGWVKTNQSSDRRICLQINRIQTKKYALSLKNLSRFRRLGTPKQASHFIK